MQKPQHILVIRFSAMGDVAMTVPVIKNVLEQHPQVQITVVSNAFLAPLFAGIDRCHFYGAQLKTTHRGVAGIYRLFTELKATTKFTAVADLHGVLRASLLKLFFSLSGFTSAVIDKGRKEKKDLTQKEEKVLKQLPTSHERYADVFKRLGLPVKLNNDFPVFTKQSLPPGLDHLFVPDKKIIGVAPFAQHQEKMYPLEKMKIVVQQLAIENTVLLFGGGGTETALLQSWADEITGVHNMSGKFSLQEELAIISNIDLMLSMDSANMHLAALFGVRVVSIWGATHPFAGFTGWAQQSADQVQVDLYCRPCSVFGNKPCYRGDHACMNQISTAMIIDKINRSKH